MINFTGMVPTVQCCGSGMFIPDPDFYPSRIPDPKTATKERVKKLVVISFFVATNITKLKNYLIFELVKKKIRANLQRIIYGNFFPLMRSRIRIQISI
jgi:hypothetical protein